MDVQVRHDTVFDAGAEHLGRVYAEALMGAAKRAGVTEAVVDQLDELVTDVIQQHPSLAGVLASPRVDAENKKRIIDRLFADSLDPLLIRFLKVSADRGRLGYLRSIAAAARAIRNEELGRVIAEVRSAVPLSEELRQMVVERLTQSLNRNIELREKVDAQLIGGLVIRVGDTVFDSSISGRLSAMSKQTRKAFVRRLLENSDRFVPGLTP